MVHTISVVPHITSTSPSRSAPARICSQMASMAPIPNTGPFPCTRPAAVPMVSTRGICSAVAPRSAHAAGFQPVPSNKGNAVAAVATSITASPARAWLATAGAGQYPAAPGASAAVQRRNSAASPSAGSSWLSAPGARPLSSPYSNPGVTGRPAASTAVSDGTIAATATARASATPSWSSAVSGPRRHASSASCSSRSGAGTRSWCGIRTRAVTWPFSSAATALTAVVPMSMPIVTSLLVTFLRDTGVTVRQHWHS